MSDELGLMCVHAHPDDEAIQTGGVLLRAAQTGIRTAVVTCTGGERGEIYNMDVEATRPRLAEVRRAELTAALEILGAGTPRYLGYVDSGMMGTDGNDDPQSFWRASMDDAIGRLVAHIREFRPDVLVTYDAFGGYGHPDHIQTHRVALLAAEACAEAALYPRQGPPWRVRKVYMTTLPKSALHEATRLLRDMGQELVFGDHDDPAEFPMGTPDDAIGAAVDVRDVYADKMAALRQHRSQLEESSFFMALPDEIAIEWFGREWFVRHRSDVPVDGVEADLFTGLRP